MNKEISNKDDLYKDLNYDKDKIFDSDGIIFEDIRNFLIGYNYKNNELLLIIREDFEKFINNKDVLIIDGKDLDCDICNKEEFINNIWYLLNT